MITNKGQPNQLDGKQCFLAWYELGSVKKAFEKFKREGLKNKYTGKPFTENGIYHAALVWVCENNKESREYYIKAGSFTAENDLLWEEWLVRTYMSRYPRQRKKFSNWARVNGFYRKYFNKFADFYGIVDPDEFDPPMEA